VKSDRNRENTVKSGKHREKTRFSRENAIFSVGKSGQSNFIPEYENTKSAKYPGKKKSEKKVGATG